MERIDPFSELELAGLKLRNRLIKTATYEGLTKIGVPTPALRDWHVKLINGGVSMTTMAYSAISNEGATFRDQVVIHEGILEELSDFTSAIHLARGKASIQLAHCGFFSKNERHRSKPISPSRTLNKLGLFSGKPYSRSMTPEDLQRTLRSYEKAAKTAVECGFDAIEVHCGHGYLLSQFLSPAFNKRNDEFGGELENRLRFPIQVLQAVRNQIGERPLIVKMNLEDGFTGGLTIDDSLSIAKAFESAGVSALMLSGGFTSVNAFHLLRGDIPLKEMIEVEKNGWQKWGIRLFGPWVMKHYPFEPLYYLELAKRIRSAVGIPLIYVGGVTGLDDMQTVLNEGFDLIALGRPLIHDPNFVNMIRSGEIKRTGCIYCNKCVPEIDNGGVKCVIN